jgi:hypothetical protein
MGVRRLVVAVAAALLCYLQNTEAAAQSSAPPTRQLRWAPALDATVTFGGAAAWIASELFKAGIAPPHCHWCNVDDIDAQARSALVWSDTAGAETISNVTGFILAPMAAVGLNAVAAAHEGATGNVPEDTLLIAEAGVIAADVDQMTKLLVGRERPFVHALAPDEKPLTFHSSDNNLSFYSGHTTETFALATASGTIGEMRGYRWAPLAWGVGGALAAATAYLRIAADKHWLSDVVVGAVVGAGIGFLVPYLFHSAIDEKVRASTGAALSGRPQFAGPTMTFAW